MNNLLMEPMLSKMEYEEHVRYLQRLYGGQSTPGQPGVFAQLGDTALYLLGGGLVTLGERMQSRHKTHLLLPTMK